MPPDATGLLLAGGQSRRFGADKARAELDGLPLIAHAYAALAPLCTEVLVSVDRPDRRYPLPGPARYVADAEPGAGPLAGLLAGLEAMNTPYLLVLACDLPFVRTEALRALLAAVRPVDDAVVAHDGTRSQPLCALYARRTRALAADQLAAGERALHAFLARLAVRPLPLPGDALRNVNTPADLRATRSRSRPR